MKNAIRATIAAAAIGAAIGTAAQASATPSQDGTYLQLLTSHGLTYGSADAAIRQGHAVCNALDNGTSIGTVIRVVENTLSLTLDQTSWMMAASVVAYCPWNIPTDTSTTSSGSTV